jgi:hypothetical protein
LIAHVDGVWKPYPPGRFESCSTGLGELDRGLGGGVRLVSLPQLGAA